MKDGCVCTDRLHHSKTKRSQAMTEQTYNIPFQTF